MSNPKLYLAAPFFTPEQVQLVSDIEVLTSDMGFDLFSPRLAVNAQEMNALLKAGHLPSDELRQRVFEDNYRNIDDAYVLLAVIDGRDTGVTWELAYAYAVGCPVVMTYTDKLYGMNLMLAQSVDAHVKGLSQLKDALYLVQESYRGESAMIELSDRFHSPVALREGPAEHEDK